MAVTVSSAGNPWLLETCMDCNTIFSGFSKITNIILVMCLFLRSYMWCSVLHEFCMYKLKDVCPQDFAFINEMSVGQVLEVLMLINAV